MIPTSLPLAAEFPPASHADWRKLVDAVLKGRPFDKVLVNRSYDGLTIEPLYARAGDAVAIAGRPPGRPWTIVQRVDNPDPVAANVQALDDLENGATGLSLVFAGGVGAHGFGLREISPALLEAVLKDVLLDADVHIGLNPIPGALDLAPITADLVRRRGVDPARTRIHFNFQPLSMVAARGSASLEWSDAICMCTTRLNGLREQGFTGPFILADGRVVHDSGGSEAQELAFTLAAALTHLRGLEEQGWPLDAARDAIAFRLAADADQFMTMAKFRALRLLWAQIETQCGLTPKPAFVSAETAWRMMTQRDPYVNVLRATVAVTAAGLAGADAISVLPHSFARELPDASARRLARNLQLVLTAESHLHRVADPAAGSGGLEALTAAVAAKAWDLLQMIEKQGGLWRALIDGGFQDAVAATRSQRLCAIASRRDALTGLSEFPNIAEEPIPTCPERLIGSSHFGEVRFRFKSLPALRLAEPYEKLRDKSDRRLRQSGQRPRVFLAALGTPADSIARATFAKNFFEAGGIEAVGSDGANDPAALSAAFKASGARLACLASSDAIYGREAEAAARALTEAGAAHLYLAGKGGEHEAALKAAGIGTFIHAGSDVLATLTDAYAVLDGDSKTGAEA